VTRTVAEEHFAFKNHLTAKPDPFHARYDDLGRLTVVGPTAAAAGSALTFQYDVNSALVGAWDGLAGMALSATDDVLSWQFA